MQLAQFILAIISLAACGLTILLLVFIAEWLELHDVGEWVEGIVTWAWFISLVVFIICSIALKSNRI